MRNLDFSLSLALDLSLYCIREWYGYVWLLENLRENIGEKNFKEVEGKKKQNIIKIMLNYRRKKK